MADALRRCSETVCYLGYYRQAPPVGPLQDAVDHEAPAISYLRQHMRNAASVHRHSPGIYQLHAEAIHPLVLANFDLHARMTQIFSISSRNPLNSSGARPFWTHQVR